jgi:hypothetical protein
MIYTSKLHKEIYIDFSFLRSPEPISLRESFLFHGKKAAYIPFSVLAKERCGFGLSNNILRKLKKLGVPVKGKSKLFLDDEFYFNKDYNIQMDCLILNWTPTFHRYENTITLAEHE